MKIYLHDDIQGHVYRALFYGTPHWDDYIKFLILEPSHEIGDTLREKLTEKKNNFNKSLFGLGLSHSLLPPWRLPQVQILQNRKRRII